MKSRSSDPAWPTLAANGVGLGLKPEHAEDVLSGAHIDAFPLHRAGEIHLAGFAEDRDDENRRLLIDAHGTTIAETVWALYRRTIARCGPVPTLIERDNNVPPFAALAAEAARAKSVLDHARRLQAAA
jgi:uncharacterized protein (UPF0276 family)